MFSTITWEAFLTTVATFTAAYYAITVLLLYYKEIIRWFKSRSAKEITKPVSDQKNLSEIIGNVREQNAVTRISSVGIEEVSVAYNDQDAKEEPDVIKVFKGIPPEKDSLLTGSVADLMQEINTLFQLMADYKSDKAECESLFRTLLLRYPHVRKTDYRLNISEYIAKEGTTACAFEIQLSEANSWWEEPA